MTKIAYVVNEARFFVSHRLALAVEAQECGWDVVVVCGANTGEHALTELGFTHRALPLSRSGFNPLQEWRTLGALRRVYRQEAPDIVHHVTIKPVIYGTPLARAAKVPAVVNAVPGMGFVFTRRGAIAAIRRAFVNLMYRAAMSHSNMRVIFQNSEDLRGFLGHGIVTRDQAVLIRGSGVDLQRFPIQPESNDPPVFILVARMLKDKGVREFVKAAQSVRAQHPDWRFQLVGDVDPGNPSSLTREELEQWEQDGIIRWLHHRGDVAELMTQAHVVCLPSYREGLPKTLLEGSAAGRALLASDVAGCREVIYPEVNGLLVPPRDEVALANAMRRLGEDAKLRQRLGEAARQRAEAVFSIEDVVHHTFLLYASLLDL